MYKTKETRRTFLKSATLAAGSLLLSSQTRSESKASMSAARLRVRPDVATLQPQGGQDHPIIRTFKKAVDLMKRGQVSNEHFQWEVQAKIHTDWCPHRNWFFLPWHRAYLSYFEEIIRKVAGDDSFVLPYWNWSKDPQVPAAFWGDGNPLFNQTREISADEAMPAEAVGKEVIDTILSTGDFELFGSARSSNQRQPAIEGQLEATPHDTVHGTILGDMGFVALSARDPIFWLHHANLDRLWEQWNIAGHKNTNESAWRQFDFTNNFFNSNGDTVPSIKVGDLDSTAKRGYRYDDQPAEAPPPRFASIFKSVNELTFAATNSEAVKPEAPLATNLKPSRQFFEITRGAASPVKPQRQTEIIRLVITDITPPKENGTLVRVFLNCPYLSLETPINDPHYVGSFSFFDVGAHADEGHNKSAYSFDLTDALRKLNRVQRLPKEQIQVQLLTVPKKNKKEAPVEFLPSKFEVSVARLQE